MPARSLEKGQREALSRPRGKGLAVSHLLPPHEPDVDASGAGDGGERDEFAEERPRGRRDAQPRDELRQSDGDRAGRQGCGGVGGYG